MVDRREQPLRSGAAAEALPAPKEADLFSDDELEVVVGGVSRIEDQHYPGKMLPPRNGLRQLDVEGEEG